MKKLKTIIELIKEQLNKPLISDTVALGIVERTIGRQVDWTNSNAIDKAFFDFIETKQAIVYH